MRRQHCFSVVLVGKNGLRREGLAGILRSANFRILTSVSSADDLHARKAPSCEVLFLVVHSGDEFDATVEQIELCRSHRPDGRIAVVADRYQMNELVSAFRAGATGYFVDITTRDVFIKSIELVMMGETVFPATFLSGTLDPAADGPNGAGSRDNSDTAIIASDDRTSPQLSPREKSILRCLIEGDSNKCIARKINIAEATVKVHIKAILRKVRVHNRTQAAIWGMNNGSLTRPANDSSRPLIPDSSNPDSNKVIGEIRQVEGPTLACAVNHQANHVDVAHIESLIPRRTLGTTQK
ncbi:MULTISPECIES: response regulator transcription factor [unclassified Bradyrhizobium]|uniref:LuxR C-terminal-related transcriptional regulator n=1 Tax=unclassified Bradyrhizobium TaxID=2631580 RepID=UPI0024788AAA|nr:MULTISPECIES: response regulator transcription factor [unclassified Bradyrhizobium]WGS18475.1 response regulator transcription factor [Bradyrhizobium sp. ISRA463]WGS25300.1 response regulator transcription factor [Bradyrhizobium sp. ISRA464]